MRTLNTATLCDIGANKGQFSLLARTLWPHCRIIAFEPLARPAKVYKTVFSGDPLVELHQTAIANKTESAAMHVSAREDSSSLLPIGSEQVRFAPGTQEVASETVQLAPLSSVVSPERIQSPALLKIDVQGYEGSVLEGCQELLNCFDYIYCEMSFRELYIGQPLSSSLIRWLDDRGFRLAAVNQVSLDSEDIPVQADFLFRRKVA